jgi:hypothetical protein
MTTKKATKKKTTPKPDVRAAPDVTADTDLMPPPEPTPAPPPPPKPRVFHDNKDVHGRSLVDGSTVIFVRPGASKRERGVVHDANHAKGVVLVRLEAPLPQEASVPGVVDYTQNPTPIAVGHLHRE